MSYLNFNRRLSRCRTCGQPVTNDRRVKTDHSSDHDKARVYATLTPAAITYWRTVRRDRIRREEAS